MIGTETPLELNTVEAERLLEEVSDRINLCERSSEYLRAFSEDLISRTRLKAAPIRLKFSKHLSKGSIA